MEGYDEKSLLKSFNKNSIRNIQSAYDFNLIVRNVERDEISKFKQIIEETGKRQGFKDKDLDYYYKLYDAFEDKAAFLIAEVNPKKSIEALDVKQADLDEKSKQFKQQYHAMKQALERKIDKYNFLGIQGIFDGSDGVLRFKQNFNGYIVRKAGTFRYYPNPIKFKCLQFLKKIIGR